MKTASCDYAIKLYPSEEEYQDGKRNWQGIPSIAKATNGRLWASWYSGGTTEGAGNWTVLYTSDDDGDSWKGPVLVIDSENDFRAFDANLWMDPDGRMWLIWQQNNHSGNCVCSVWAIHTSNPEDENPVWSEPTRIANGVAINNPIVLRDGTWVLPTAVWEMHINELLGKENNAGCYISKDKGATWEYQGGIENLAGKRQHEENMIVEQSDGSLRMLIRSSVGIEESFSYDGGKTWSDGKDPQLSSTVSKFYVGRLTSGNMLLVYHNPPENDGSRTYLTAALSLDDGQTWPYKLTIDRRFEVSYPDAQQDREGNIYIVYDCNRWSSMEIQMAKITEEDIMAGQLVTKGSFLKKLVNNNGAVECLQPDFEYSDGAQVSMKNMAKVAVAGGKIDTIEVGNPLFCNEDYVFSETMPEQLRGKAYWITSTDDSNKTVKVLEEGTMYVITYVDADSPIQQLRDQGFRTQITLPRGQLAEAYGLPLAFMEKQVAVGEEIALCNWSIVIARE